jgi:hypothetical protein
MSFRSLNAFALSSQNVTDCAQGSSSKGTLFGAQSFKLCANDEFILLVLGLALTLTPALLPLCV